MASIKVSVMAGTLFTLCVILGTSAHAAYVCCRRYMRGILPFSDITGFSEQKNYELCSINAIIFHTKQGKICANPDLEWVKDYIKRIKSMVQR
ncbi:PREDICTED: C-C motif chemokine 20-like [Cyprinodon variegatus]|uniref:C-C motif chemokine n=1 Tax=Cyprinodon variegatus TaxID=28743 RepID=A0A3Q2DSQ1_CYPVA|nr:PREDICTED: C-C motif chemokine 20-like [Cyprinodon variegatus]